MQLWLDRQYQIATLPNNEWLFAFETSEQLLQCFNMDIGDNILFIKDTDNLIINHAAIHIWEWYLLSKKINWKLYIQTLNQAINTFKPECMTIDAPDLSVFEEE